MGVSEGYPKPNVLEIQEDLMYNTYREMSMNLLCFALEDLIVNMYIKALIEKY